MSSRCNVCKKKTYFVEFKCALCEHIYCTKCRLPEDHKCINLEKFRNDKTLLKEKLEKEAIKENHNYYKI